MFRRSSLVLEKFYKQSTSICRFSTTVSEAEATPDPKNYFFSSHVQSLMRTLTRPDHERVFESRKDGVRLKSPVYKFLSVEELEEYQAKVDKKAHVRLQMPPVVKAREDTLDVISEDHDLRGLNTMKYVFTDISFGISNKNRLIVVREPDGMLRHAFTNERSRMNQVYFPILGKEMHTPKMFLEPHFASLLEREEYVFILDRACLQFEPDDPEYHRISNAVYEDLNAKRKFESLRSTRHFGPLAFYLAWEKKIDNLLVDVIQSQKIHEAVALMKLYYIFHKDAISASTAPYQDDITMLKSYAKLESSKRHDIEHALLVYQKLQKEIQELEASKMESQDLVGNEQVSTDESKQEQ